MKKSNKIPLKLELSLRETSRQYYLNAEWPNYPFMQNPAEYMQLVGALITAESWRKIVIAVSDENSARKTLHEHALLTREKGQDSRRYSVFGFAVLSVPPVIDVVLWLSDQHFVTRVEDLEEPVSLIGPIQSNSVKPDLRESRRMLLDPSKLPSDFVTRIGEGIKVGVLDTGIDAEHPDLNGRVGASHNFSSDQSTDDFYGHGTHVAGIIANSGIASSAKYVGIAPCCQILNLKVLNRLGIGTTKSVLDGLAKAYEEGVDIVNLSLGSSSARADGQSILSKAVDRLFEGDICIAASAGNGGPDFNTITCPADARGALAVGAVSKRKELADFSSRGPTEDGRIKPDVVAPGVDIVSARSGISSLPPLPSEPHYTTLSGTSMAAPHIAGVLALIKSYARWKGKPITAIRLYDILKAHSQKVSSQIRAVDYASG